MNLSSIYYYLLVQLVLMPHQNVKETVYLLIVALQVSLKDQTVLMWGRQVLTNLLHNSQLI